MEIFSICGRVAALGYTYFRVLCVCLSTFLASVLVRVLHPCVAHELWKLLRGCNCCVLIWWTHLTDGMLFVCLCTLLLWSGCGKHLTGSLVLPFPAAVWMKVECIPQAICSCTCVWKLEREKHLRITQSGLYTRTPQARSIFYVECPFTKLILKPVSALPSPKIAFLVIVLLSFRLSFGATKKQKIRVSKAKRNLILLCMVGSILLQASQEWFTLAVLLRARAFN